MGLKSAFLPILLALLLVMGGASNSFNENGAVQHDESNNIIRTVISVVVFIFVIFVIVDLVTDIFSPNGEV